MMKRMVMGVLVLALVGTGGAWGEVPATTRGAEGRKVYVSPAGDDGAAGTEEKPRKSVVRAVEAVGVGGGTVVLRGGNYEMTETVRLRGSGAEGRPLRLVAFGGETAVLDFARAPADAKGIRVMGDWWELKGLEVVHARGGMWVTGSHIRIERCATHDNTESGMQFADGASQVKVVNCDSYDNADPAANYANADGFAPKLTVGDGISFYGCRAWGNCDDGWDGYMRGATNVTTTLENCWAFRNGWLKDGSDPGPQANGNGFKLGGGDNGNAARQMHHFVVKNCLAFENKVKGFDQNNNVGSMTLVNCTAFKNGGGNFVFWKELEPGQKAVFRKCVSLEGGVRLPTWAVQEGNSWQLKESPKAEEFESVKAEGVMGKRRADGSLPEVTFMRAKAGGRLVGMGWREMTNDQ